MKRIENGKGGEGTTSGGERGGEKNRGRREVGGRGRGEEEEGAGLE